MPFASTSAPPRAAGNRGLRAAFARLALIFTIAAAGTAAAQTEPVNIPDPVLRAKLETALSKAAGETITRAELETWSRGAALNLIRSAADRNDPALAIRDLTGLEWATGLDRLWAEHNQISDLTPLAGLTSLSVLDLSHNRIADISPLAGHIYLLETLELDGNRISDISPLVRIYSLKTLNLAGNRIADITPLAGLANRQPRILDTLNLADNRIGDLTPLADLTSLTFLSLHNNRFASLEPLRRLTSLNSLGLDRNERVTDVSPLQGLSGLNVLDLEGTGVMDIGPLAAGSAPYGNRLDLRDTPLNADAATHVATLRARGAQVFILEPIGSTRTPRGLQVTPGVESLTVEWNPVTTATGFNPQGYRVYWRSGGQIISSRVDPPRHHDVAGLGTIRYVIPGLTPGTEYGVVVATHSPYGGLSAEAHGTPLAFRAENVAVAPGVESLVVSWDPVDGASDYKVQWKSGEEDYDPAARQAPAGGADKTSYTVRDLLPGTEYTVRVIAARAGEPDGEPSAEATGIPRSAEEFEVDVEEGLRSLVVSWLEVPRATSYRVQWRRTDTPEFGTADAACLYVREQACGTASQSGPAGAGPRVTYTIADLEPDIEYTVLVTPMLEEQPLGDPDDGTGRPLRKTVVAIVGGEGTVAGVGSATVLEGGEAELLVMLDRPSRARVTVTWSTGDDDAAKAGERAKAGEDYRATTAGRLVFQPGEDEAMLRIPTLDDRRVEPAETFRVRLTAATYAEPDPEAASATVTIVDDDTAPQRRLALQKVLAGAAGRIAAQALEAIGDRPEKRDGATLGGQALVAAGGRQAPPGDRGFSRAMSAEELLTGSSFDLALAGAGAEAGWRVWGRAATTGFDGRPRPDFRYDGDLLGGFVGVERRVGADALAGLALSHSLGDIDYAAEGVTDGAVDIALTGLLPYAHWNPRPELGVWGALGIGWGDLDLEDEAGAVSTGLEMRMAAAGLRHQLARWQDIGLAVKADAFLASLEADAARDLPRSQGDASRLRLAVEGGKAWQLSEGELAEVGLDLGARRDGGDAESGLGLELGAGFDYADAGGGLELGMDARYLLAHADKLKEWSAAATARLDPGAAGLGPWLAVAPQWRHRRQAADLDLGYGLRAWGGQGLLTPYAGLSVGDRWRRGWKLGARAGLGATASLGLEGAWRHRGPQLDLSAALRW